MKLSMKYLSVVAFGICIGVVLSIGPGALAERNNAPHGVLPLDELHTFSQIFGKVKDDYVKEISDKELLEHAIRGMLTGLDPHSTYLDRDEFTELQVGTTGQFGGLGIEVTMEDGFVKVVTPIDDTPAQRAGVQAGDLVIRLGDQPVKGLNLSEAVKIMRGEPGTSITLTIVREGENKPFEIPIVRDIIRVQSIKSRTLESGFGYLRITNFQSKTAEHMLRAIDELRKENGGELKGMVLDLRNNPGGVLSSAVSISDAFLEKGTIVYTEGRANDAVMRFNATPRDVLNGTPIVVLINGGSASAAEIVAGALQDQNRAVVMGSKSFGKGSVQTVIPMNNDTAIKLTTALYFTPNGRSIQAEGIVPDIELEPLDLAESENDRLAPVKEKDLNRHLDNGSDKEPQAEEKSDTEESESEDDEPLAASDYMLHEALTLLKGLQIMQSRTQ